MSVDLVFITYNRLAYTKLALASVLADRNEKFSLTIWDNASTDGTVEYLRNLAGDSRISDIVFSKENIGQIAVLNRLWDNSKADFVGKVDNDCLVTAGWTRTLTQAHEDIPQLGVVACWHFFPEDFDDDSAKHKIQRFGKHQILRHPWTCGTGLLIKRRTFKKFGPLPKSATTKYWLTIALAGYINGFYYPLIYQEHMDDPRSEHNMVRRMAFEEAYKDAYGYQKGVFTNLEEYHTLHSEILNNLLTGSYDPRYYAGWRAKLIRAMRLVTNTATRKL